MAFGDYATLIDNFNRADENPLSGGGTWSNKVVSSNGNMLLASNQVTGASGSICSAWYNASQPGADCEAYATIASKPGVSGINIRVYLRIATPGTAGVDGYFVQMTGGTTETWNLYILTNASATSLANGTQVLTNGDKFGLSCIGSTIAAYYYTGGSWSLLASVTDATYSAAGYAGIAANGGTGKGILDDFYFGTVAAATSTFVPRAVLI